MYTKRTRSILSRKHLLWPLLHGVYVTAFSGKHSVRERENANMRLFLVREKHFWKNQKNAIGKKAGKINTVTISNCDYCNYISLKEKERRVKHFIVYVTYFQISKDFSSPLFNNRGTARRHSSLSYTALLRFPAHSRSWVLNQQWQSLYIFPVHSHYFLK